MTDIYNKKLSLFVAWYNILWTIAMPFLLFAAKWFGYIDLTEYYVYEVPFLVVLSLSLIPWLIASILLLKGIKQNRPKLIAFWIYFSYVLLILHIVTVIYKASNKIMHQGKLEDALMQSLSGLVSCVILILCIIPVTRLYKRMTSPPSVQPTQFVKAPQEAQEEVGPRYMPVFENV